MAHTNRPGRWQWAVLAAGLLAYAALHGTVSWQRLHARKGAKDHPSFHYAVEVAAEGGDPYDAQALQEAADADGLRTEVYPWVYPPPALLAFSWTLPLSYSWSQDLAWFGHQGSLALLLVVLWRWFRAPPALLGLSVVAFTPLRHSFQVGQINPTIALLATWGVARSRGVALAAAAWVKMSPAILVLPWVLRRQWRPLAAVAGASLLLSVLALPLAGPETQLHFYRTVLPALGQGSYNGMSVPLDLPANHSLANAFHLLTNGTDPHRLSSLAGTLAKASSLVLLLPALWLARRRRDPLGEALVFGAFGVAMVHTPAYTYEHHLVLLLPGFVAAWTAALRSRLPRWSLVLLILSSAATLWPLEAFRAALRAAPHHAWWIRETKLAGPLLLWALCLLAASRPAGPSAPEPEPRA